MQKETGQELELAFLEQALEAIVIVNSNAEIVMFNKSAEHLLGFTEEDVLGKNINTILPHERGDEHTHYMKDFFQNPRVRPAAYHGLSLVVQRKDGSVIPVSISLNPIKTKKGNYVVTLITDITYVKETENALRKSEAVARDFQSCLQRLQQIGIELSQAEDIDDIYRLAVQEAHTLGFERFAILMADYERGVIYGTYGIDKAGNLRKEHDFENPLSAEDWFIDVLGSRNRVTLWENAPLTDYGETLQYGWKVGAALWDGDKAIGYLVTDSLLSNRPVREYEEELLSLYAITITNLITNKRSEEQSLELKLEKAKSGVITQFIRDATHEFRTPLSIILTNLHILERSPDDLKNRIDVIHEQVNHIDTLVNALSTISRLDGEPEKNISELDVNELVRWLSSAGDIELHLDESVPHIKGNRTDLNLALKHLIANAQQATKNGGKITITTVNEGAKVKIIVKDTGIGMEETVQARIFERFYRRDTAHSTRGLGIGLPIVKKIIELHGGSVSVKSTPNEGSTFTITLPIHNIGPH